MANIMSYAGFLKGKQETCGIFEIVRNLLRKMEYTRLVTNAKKNELISRH
jgi:hypothetical protein